MSNGEEGVIHRRNVSRNDGGDLGIAHDAPVSAEEDDIDEDLKLRRQLTLMEEVFLLGLKDREGYTSFWNGSLSLGLRGCILVELGLRGRIKLEEAGTVRKSLYRRKVLMRNSTPTGECLLDEALKLIREVHPPESIGDWISYLSGETWNLLKRRYHMKNVRERIAKGLVEKGVLSNEKFSFLIFDVAIHPLHDTTAKLELVKKVQEAVLSNWTNDFSRMDKRVLALVLLAQASEVLVNAIDLLGNDEYAIASKRLSDLSSLDLQEESAKDDSLDIIWAVVDHLCR